MEADKSPQQWRPIIPYKLRCDKGCEEEEEEKELEEEAEEELEGTKRDSSSSERISFEMLYVIIWKLGIERNCLFTLSTSDFWVSTPNTL